MIADVRREVVGVELPELQSGWGLPLARGTYYRPAEQWPRIGFIAAHYNLDFSHHYLAPLLASRGFGFLGWNTRFCGREAYFLLDRALLDLDHAVGWLREHGVEVVVLLGNSGGGSLLAAYQAQACQAVVRAPYGMSLTAGIDALRPADLYVSLAAHPGRPEVLTSWLDPSVHDEHSVEPSDPALDMYDPENGPPYSPEFLERYRAAQRTRNQRITDWCKVELERLQESGFRDRLFTVSRVWADPRFLDPSLDPSERPTPACYLGEPQRANRGVEGLASLCTLRTWLSMWSLQESQCSSSEYLEHIRASAIVIQAAADVGVFPSDAQAIFEGLGSEDKELRHMPGDHYFARPAAARENLAELITDWVVERASGV